tara:strand:+ start:15047 stop:15205 length:159 start_codon:yes stop_codon:yes gene_type:complete
MENKIGLGDIVEKTIKTVTFGKVKPCKKCNKRKEILNKFNLPFSSYNPDKNK